MTIFLPFKSNPPYSVIKIFFSLWASSIFQEAGPATPGEVGGGGGMPPSPPPLFFCGKIKRETKGIKKRVSKQKLLQGCHQDQNIIVLTILECLEFEIFSCWPTMVADNTFQCSIISVP